MIPTPKNGKCCPNGHEGYVKEFTGYSEVTHHYDFVKLK